MGIGDGTETVVDTPVREELLGHGSSNSGPPSVVMSFGMPKVTKVMHRVPLMDLSTMGQPEYRSTITTYVCPLWWKKSAHRLWKGLVGRVGGVGGRDAWEGDIMLHSSMAA